MERRTVSARSLVLDANGVAHRPLGEEDDWFHTPDGQFWGKFGAAGLLLVHPTEGVLLQLRSHWSHFGGTWGLPGGAMKRGETAEEGALREAHEEAGVPLEAVEVLGRRTVSYGSWQYTTVLACSIRDFNPEIGDAESDALRWVHLEHVQDLNLHPELALAWPHLHEILAGEQWVR